MNGVFGAYLRKSQKADSSMALTITEEVLAFLRGKPPDSLAILEQNCYPTRDSVLLITYERVVQELSILISSNTICPSQIYNQALHTSVFLPEVSQMTWKERNIALQIDIQSMSSQLVFDTLFVEECNPETSTNPSPQIRNWSPFWTNAHKELSRQLLIPTLTTTSTSPLNWSDISSTTPIHSNSWFLSNNTHVNQRTTTTLATASQFSPVSTPPTSETTELRSRKILLYPTPKQRSTLKELFGLSRWFYNRAVDCAESKKIYNFELLKAQVSAKINIHNDTCFHVLSTGSLCNNPCDGTLCTRHAPQIRCGHIKDDHQQCDKYTTNPYCNKHRKRNMCPALKRDNTVCNQPCENTHCPRHASGRRASQFDDVLPEWWQGKPYVPRFITGAIMDCAKAYNSTFANLNNGNITHFDMKYRTKKMRVQSLYLEKTCFYKRDNSFLSRFFGDIRTASYKSGNRIVERFKDMSIKSDGRLLWDQGTDKWYFRLSVPSTESQGADNNTLSDISLDPGTRTLLTGYSPEGTVLAFGDWTRRVLRNLLVAQDRLRSKLAHPRTRKRRQKRMYWRCFFRLSERIQNMVDDLHNKSIKYLVTHYSTVILGALDVRSILKQTGRYALSSSNKRLLCTLRHYDLKTKLERKCTEYNVRYILQPEQWTSKTCCNCGWIHRDLRGRKVFMCQDCGVVIDRDVNGAINIYLRACHENV